MKKKFLGGVLAGFLGLLLSSCFSPDFPNTCFLPGTRIATPTGDVAIEELALGQEVFAYDEEAKTVVPGVVEKITETDTESYLRLTLSTGRVLLVTGDHPLAAAGDGEGAVIWLQAAATTKDSKLYSLDDRLQLQPTEITEHEHVQEPTKVYNLKVRRYHNSFAEGVLSHFYFASPP